MARAVFLAVLMGTVFAWADTIRFKDGSTMDGVVSRPDDATIAVQSGKARLTFPADTVASIEANDKTGDSASLANIAGKQHAQQLDERTGLNRAQRDEVRRVVEGLWSPDERVRNEARAQLVAMNKQMPVYRFLEQYVGYAKGAIVPEILKTLSEIDPQQTRGIVIGQTQNTDPGCRAKALDLMASQGNPEDVDTVARGLVDMEPDVRIAAANALARMGDARATPALIENVASADPRVRNAARSALAAIWKEKGGGGLAEADAAAWQRFWSDNARQVQQPIDNAALEPLVTPEAMEGLSASHDE